LLVVALALSAVVASGKSSAAKAPKESDRGSNAVAATSAAANEGLRKGQPVSVTLVAPQAETFLGLAADAWVAIFTAALTISTVLMWLETRRVAKGGEAALRHSEISANAARVATEMAVASQRAVVACEPYWTMPVLHPQNFGVKWVNVGNSATRGLRNHIDFRLLGGELPEDFSFPDDAPAIATGTVLAPKSSVMGPHVPPTGSISWAEISEIKSGIKNFYFFGWAKYYDGVPGTPERVTKFCYKLRVTGNADMPFVFIPYEKHNSFDEG